MPSNVISLVVVPGLLLLAAPPLASATGTDYSCSVDTQTVKTCEFLCTPGPIAVSASASQGQVGISASCGGGSAGCTAKANEPCQDEGEATSSGTGRCSITESGPFVDEGTGSCSGTSAPRPPCAIQVAGICIIHGAPSADHETLVAQAKTLVNLIGVPTVPEPKPMKMEWEFR